jgi:hypothetical protein
MLIKTMPGDNERAEEKKSSGNGANRHFWQTAV